MRRLLSSILAMSFMGMLIGCHATHGVCDCSHDFDDSCAYRAPWIHEGAPKTDAPAVPPESREPLPNAPKKL